MISAIVLAAGESKRMGQPKMLLPWGRSTILGQVLSVLRRALQPEALLVVTGAARQEVEEIAETQGARTVFNPNYKAGGMLASIRVGLAELDSRTQAAFICLGDQPTIDAELLESLTAEYHRTERKLVVPSFQMHRGHPWLLDRSLWGALLAGSEFTSARDFLVHHASEIHYVDVAEPFTLEDIDTLDEYRKKRPAENDGGS